MSTKVDVQDPTTLLYMTSDNNPNDFAWKKVPTQ